MFLWGQTGAAMRVKVQKRKRNDILFTLYVHPLFTKQAKIESSHPQLIKHYFTRSTNRQVKATLFLNLPINFGLQTNLYK